MTLEEAIEHCKQVADEQLGRATASYSDCYKCAEAHIQLADWLTQLKIFRGNDLGEISDGYHTFNQLYHQRAILFATIVNQNKNIAWKSFKHSDGEYCFDSNGEWFIVGIDTPEGSYTYHYEKKYWDLFHCIELECGKEWDGHTEDDVTRLLTLECEHFNDAQFNEHEDVVDGCIDTDQTKARQLTIHSIEEWDAVKSELSDQINSMNELHDYERMYGLELALDIVNKHLNAICTTS